MKQEELQGKIKGLFEKALKGSDVGPVGIIFSESLPHVRLQAPFCLLNFLTFNNSVAVCTSKSERRHYKTTSVTLSVRVVASRAFDLATKITSWFEEARLIPLGIQYSPISEPRNNTHLEPPKPGIYRYDYDISLKFTYQIQRPRNLITEVTDQTGVIYGREH